jgi:hypothetical protein
MLSKKKNGTFVYGSRGCVGGEGADCVGRKGSGEGLAVSVAFRSKTCPFLYIVKVTLSPTDLCWSIYETKSSLLTMGCLSTATIISPICFIEY